MPRLIVDMNAIKDPLGLEYHSMNTKIYFSMTAVIVVVVRLQRSRVWSCANSQQGIQTAALCGSNTSHFLRTSLFRRSPDSFRSHSHGSVVGPHRSHQWMG